MIICKICKERFQAITNTHLLKRHNLTCDKYLKMFPGEPIGGYNKKILGDKFVGIETERIRKILDHPNSYYLRAEGGRKGVKSRRKKYGSLKWKPDAPGRKSSKYKGRTPWNKNLTKYTDERLAAMANKRRKYPEKIDFRLFGWSQERAQEIRKRDYFICQKCGKKRVSIVHHRDGNRRHNEDSNLITLCRKCHREVHVEHDNSNGRFRLRKIHFQF